jgi:hypothetical protein
MPGGVRGGEGQPLSLLDLGESINEQHRSQCNKHAKPTVSIRIDRGLANSDAANAKSPAPYGRRLSNGPPGYLDKRLARRVRSNELGFVMIEPWIRNEIYAFLDFRQKAEACI